MAKVLSIAIGCALLLVSAVEAAAQPPRRAPPVQTFQQGGVGCYWYRKRYHCARYCYLEVDGKRYCVQREREAHSQAADLDREPPPEYARGRHGRYSGAK